MKLELKTCKAAGNGLVIIVREAESGRECETSIMAREVGGPFLGHADNVAVTLREVFAQVDAMLNPPAPAEEPAPETAPGPTEPSPGEPQQ